MSTLNPLSSKQFELLARKKLSDYFQKDLIKGSTSNIAKEFDFISSDGRIIGDAKYLTRVGGVRMPPAKFSVIAEYVWLLEKTTAETKFLVFGNDRRVPEWWLEKYGKLVNDVLFFFLTDEGQLAILKAN